MGPDEVLGSALAVPAAEAALQDGAAPAVTGGTPISVSGGTAVKTVENSELTSVLLSGTPSTLSTLVHKYTGTLKILNIFIFKCVNWI